MSHDHKPLMGPGPEFTTGRTPVVNPALTNPRRDIALTGQRNQPKDDRANGTEAIN